MSWYQSVPLSANNQHFRPGSSTGPGQFSEEGVIAAGGGDANLAQGIWVSMPSSLDVQLLAYSCPSRSAGAEGLRLPGDWEWEAQNRPPACPWQPQLPPIYVHLESQSTTLFVNRVLADIIN